MSPSKKKLNSEQVCSLLDLPQEPTNSTSVKIQGITINECTTYASDAKKKSGRKLANLTKCEQQTYNKRRWLLRRLHSPNWLLKKGRMCHSQSRVNSSGRLVKDQRQNSLH